MLSKRLKKEALPPFASQGSHLFSPESSHDSFQQIHRRSGRQRHPDRLRDALDGYKTTRSFEGKRRQIQFIGKVMRTIDAEPLREAVAQYQLGHAHNALALHQAERWRAELIADDKDAVTRWVADFPDTDVQQLRTLIRNARKDAALEPEKRSGRAYRELFQFIKRTMEAHDKGDASPDQGANT